MNQNQVVTNNMVMNTFLLISQNNEAMRAQAQFPQKTASVDDFMDYFTNRYKNILPQRFNMDFNFKNMLFPFEKDQIIELLNQLDIMIQLLLQVRIEKC